MDAQIAEWFVNENLIPVVRRGWKKIVRNPVVIAIAIAALVIGGVAAYRVYEHLRDFPGADKARRLLTVGASNRSVLLDPLQTEAGALSDLFFLKHRLEHYDVPAEFAEFKTLGARFLTTTKCTAWRRSGWWKSECSSSSFPPSRTSRGRSTISPTGVLSSWRVGQAP